LIFSFSKKAFSFGKNLQFILLLRKLAPADAVFSCYIFFASTKRKIKEGHNMKMQHTKGIEEASEKIEWTEKKRGK
jgi:hypothetical protein